ncbi:MAG: hypothetical protein FJX75_07475 [Armatimonadetes bacterium]|nr:hypothetical protein [Armatimonadota bacterium]
MKGLKRVAAIVAVAVLLGVMWYQAFAVTGVIGPVTPPGIERPAPPPAPKLSALPMEQADIDLFGRLHPVWSAF